MLYNVYLLRYNNYFNRIVKKKNTLTEYSDFIVNTFSGVNFNYADGVSTELVVNIDDDTSIDYLISEYNGYINRWFVIEAYKNRNGQYKLTLQRDVMADYWDIIASAPCFIQKGTLKGGDPFIFNDEGMVFNQIKVDEKLLHDSSQCAWIVGYISHKMDDTELKTVNAARVAPQSTFTSYDNFSSNTEYNVAVISYSNTHEMKLNQTRTSGGGQTLYSYTKMTFKNYSIIDVSYNNQSLTSVTNLSGTVSEADVNTLEIDDELNLSYSTNLSCPINTNISIVGGWNEGRVVKDSRTGNLYTIRVSSTTQSLRCYYGTYTNIDNAIDNFVNSLGLEGQATANNFVSYMTRTIKTIKFVPLNYSAYKFTMPGKDVRIHCLDSAYDVFCMPYKNMFIEYGSHNFTTNKELQLSIASFLGTTLGSNLYDVQLLPYCPCQEFISGISLNITDTDFFTPIYNTNNEVVSGFIWCSHSSFTGYIDTRWEFSNDEKIGSMTEKYRLCSPNYAGLFEFDPYKINGTLKFNYDCTYKPYQPYIHVNPVFGGLYGRDFNDVRGLICGGDFSLARIDDAFTQYEIQNKNYQQIFDRQIQHMDYNNTMNLFTGIGTGAISALSTTVSAGVMGGAGTGIAMGLGSAVGLAADTALGQLSYQESKSYTTDLYKYQLGNIQALPYSLSKTSAYNYNNKLFPFLEVYSASEKETQAAVAKLKYNGMTVNRIDNINNFVYNDETYIQGVIIRLDDLHDDYHLCVNIVDRVKQGFFVKREDVS